jgi:hypothetical protein
MSYMFLYMIHNDIPYQLLHLAPRVLQLRTLVHDKPTHNQDIPFEV